MGHCSNWTRRSNFIRYNCGTGPDDTNYMEIKVIYNNVLGIIFANMHDESISELTKVRTMGSILFGGRYRLIDFPLSNMANSGIPEVGVITKSNYQSLLDHIGSGREWDLSTKSGGLHLLPPFS